MLTGQWPLSWPCTVESADIQARQGVLSWQSGLLGAALGWLSGASDSRRINAVLAPLAAAVSPVAALPAAIATAEVQQQAGEGREVERVLSALRPALQSAPSGSANLALLRVHRLLLSGHSSHVSTDAVQLSGGSVGDAGKESDSDAAVSQRLAQAVEELRRLPASLHDTCLPLVRRVERVSLPMGNQSVESCVPACMD